MTTIRKPFFVVPLDLGTFSASSAVSGHSVFHLNRHKAIGLTWKTDTSGSAWARGVFDATRAIDFCAIVSANALAGTQYRLRLGTSQAQVDGTAPYDSGVISFISPSITREDGLYHSHLELSAVENATWWRIDISGHTGAFEASMLVLGQKLEPSRYYDFGFEYGVEDLGQMDFGRYGVIDEAEGHILRTLDFTLAWQTEAEYEASFRPMIEKLGKRGIVYCAFDPEASTYRQARTFMGVFKKPPFTKGVRKPRTFAQDYQIYSFI